MEYFREQFNNREIATFLWFLLIAPFFLTRAKICKSLSDFLRSLCHLKLLATILFMLLYSIILVAVLASIGFWNLLLLKDTIVWFSISAIAMMMRFATAANSEDILGKILRDNIKIVLLLEFLANAYTFSFLGELLFVPVVTTLVVVKVVADADEKLLPAAKLVDWILSICGLLLFSHVIGQVLTDVQQISTVKTLRNILLAPCLSIAFSPCIYLVVLYTKYDEAFLRLELGRDKEKCVKRWARFRLLSHFRLNLKKLQAFLQNHSGDLMQIQTIDDLDRVLLTRHSRNRVFS